MPGAAAHTYGTEFTQCIAVATMPRLRFKPSSSDAGCQPWNVTSTGGSPVISTSKRSRFGPKRPRRVEVLLPHQPVHRGDHDGFAVDERLPPKALRGDESGLDDADR